MALIYSFFFYVTTFLQPDLCTSISRIDFLPFQESLSPAENGCELVEFRAGERERSSGNNSVIGMGVPVAAVLHSGPLILLSV